MSRKEQPACETEQYTFPTMLRKLMKSTDTKQKELAQAIGMRPQTVSLYVQGQSFPDVNTLTKIADFFNVSADYLLGRTDVKSLDTNVQAICEYTGLSERSVKGLHTRRTDPSYSQILEVLITHPEMLQTLHTYLTMNIDSIMQITEDEQGAHFTGEYLNFFGLMDSEKRKGIPGTGELLNSAILVRVMQDLERLKHEMGGGNPNGKH